MEGVSLFFKLNAIVEIKCHLVKLSRNVTKGPVNFSQMHLILTEFHHHQTKARRVHLNLISLQIKFRAILTSQCLCSARNRHCFRYSSPVVTNITIIGTKRAQAIFISKFDKRAADCYPLTGFNWYANFFEGNYGARFGMAWHGEKLRFSMLQPRSKL